MFGFWILAAILLLLAYAWFIPILRGRLSTRPISRQKLNLELHRQRREELVAESGDDDSDSLAAELDKDLLGDLALSDTQPVVAGNVGKGTLWGALMVAPILAYVLYSQLGRPDLADFSAVPQMAATANPAMSAELESMIERLAKRLEQEPNDIKGWLLLARSYGEIERFDQALAAYERAMALEPKNLDIKGFYAEALAQANGGTFKGRPQELAEEILAVDPQHRNGLWVAAAAAAERGETGKAVATLEKLRAQFAPDSEDAKFVGGIIAKMQGRPAPAETVADTAKAEAPKKSIRVKVSLAANLKDKTAAGDTVFIFARAASGPPMPLAIARRQAGELPLEVSLDDTMGMMEGMNLAAFEELVIGARISKTGKALPSPGDLQGMTAPVKAENGKTYSIEIAEEVH